MRISKTLMTGAVAAVVSAGSANAGVVDAFATTTQTFGTSPTAYTNISGNTPAPLFAERNARRFNNGSASFGSGNVNFTFARGGSSSASAVSLVYRDGASATKDLSSIAAMSIDLTQLNLSVVGGTAATGMKFEWLLVDVNDLYMEAEQTLSSNGTSTFTFAAATIDEGFDLAQVSSLTLRVSQVGGSTSGTYSAPSSSGTLSNFNFTAVPAPGAIALLGAAGLVGARRRR